MLVSEKEEQATEWRESSRRYVCEKYGRRWCSLRSYAVQDLKVYHILIKKIKLTTALIIACNPETMLPRSSPAESRVRRARALLSHGCDAIRVH